MQDVAAIIEQEEMPPADPASASLRLVNAFFVRDLSQASRV